MLIILHRKNHLKFKYYFLTILLSIFLITPLNAQTNRNYSNEFMNIGVDAASLGMGGAVVASTKDINSGYWNPAGLVNLQDSAVALMYSNYFANIANYNYIAFAMPLNNRTSTSICKILNQIYYYFQDWKVTTC